MSEDIVADAFTISGTSPYTASVSDVVIRQNETTRLVLRSELVVNQKDRDSSVAACLMHQRRHSSKESWRDADSFNLATLKAGQEVRMNLSAGTTRKLYDALTLQYQIPVGGWYAGKQTRLTLVDTNISRIVSGREKEIMEKLLEEEGERVWDIIEDLRPGLLEAVLIKRQREARLRELHIFEEEMSCGTWSEPDWQSFFETNQWIFGYSLAYQLLIQVASQPVYGGMTFAGSGSQRGDFLMATAAQAKFTVLVEIKKPSTPLVGKLYRNKVHTIGEELAGGIAQLQSNCRTWVVDGALQPDNMSALEAEDIFTYQPKGILVVGNTSQLDNRAKRSSFELFRRGLKDPEILTYDELLERARFLVAVEP